MDMPMAFVFSTRPRRALLHSVASFMQWSIIKASDSSSLLHNTGLTYRRVSCETICVKSFS